MTQSIKGSNLPKECPNCGRQAIAISVRNDKQTASLYADTDVCEVSRDELPKKVGWMSGVEYIH